MRIFSTFSGIGGFELGILGAYTEVAGLEGETEVEGLCRDSTNDTSSDGRQPAISFVGYSEIDQYADSVYQYNLGGKNYGDITNINAKELPDFDCLVGGFPCQAFSIAGKRRGFEDTRGTLFFDLARILREKQPRLFVFENVKGLLSHDKGNTFRTIIATLDELGYDCQWQVLNSKDFGVPQNRERIFIVGHLRGTRRPEVFPITGTNKKDTQGIIQVNNPTHSNDRVYSQDGISPTLNTMQGGHRQPKIIAQRGRGNPPVQKIEPRKDDLTNTLASVQKDNMVHTGVSIRKLTPLECERLQGFPETEVSAIIDVCIDHQKNSVNVELQSLKSQILAGIAGSGRLLKTVPSAEKYSRLKSLRKNRPVHENVHIYLEGEKVKIHNHEKSLSFANGATSQSSLVLPMPTEDFAQIIAGMLQIAEKITTTGKAELAQNDSSLTAQENGSDLEKIYGCEITLPAKDVMSDLITLNASLKSITSNLLDIENIGLNLATLSYYVVNATSGYTASKTNQNYTYRLHLTERYGWTQYGQYRNRTSNAQRYKMCGNAVTVNVVQAVFNEILKGEKQ